MVIILNYFSNNLKLFVDTIYIHHDFNLYSHDLFLYSPGKTDIFRRCEKYDKDEVPKTKQVIMTHNAHIKEAETMKLRMAEAERNCARCLSTADKVTRRRKYNKLLKSNRKKPEESNDEASQSPTQDNNDNGKTAESSKNTEKASSNNTVG